MTWPTNRSPTRSACRSTPSCVNPSRSGIARLRLFSTPARISTRLSFQTPKAWSTRAAVARVTVPLPCDCSAIQYPTLISRCSQPEPVITEHADDRISFEDCDRKPLVLSELLAAGPDELQSPVQGLLLGPRHPPREVRAVGLYHGVQLLRVRLLQEPQALPVVECERQHERQSARSALSGVKPHSATAATTTARTPSDETKSAVLAALGSNAMTASEESPTPPDSDAQASARRCPRR
jgi:hypothetical protein